MYGGRLGRIIKAIPQPMCFECGTTQVQIISYMRGDPEYKCRHCKHTFKLPFTDEENDDGSSNLSELFE